MTHIVFGIFEASTIECICKVLAVVTPPVVFLVQEILLVKKVTNVLHRPPVATSLLHQRWC